MRAAPFLLAFFACRAAAAPTALELNPDEDGAPYLADYSQAVLVKARLLVAGEPVVGERVTFTLRQAADADTEFVFDDPVTDAQGYATARLTLVNGRYGGQSFIAAAPTQDVPGELYVVAASFQGEPFAENCDLDGGPSPDAGGDPDLCDADDENDLYLALETSTLVLAPGIEVELGGTVQLVATLTDANGDAAAAGVDVEGTSEKALADRRVGFFYDLSGNGRPENAERIPCANTGESFATTNDDGRAACDFFADPSFVDTVNVDQGIHAQFGGDEHYALSGAAQAITVRASAPKADATLLEADPPSAPANGFSLVAISAALVDEANNVLGADDPAYDVSFETDLGTFEAPAARDPLTGRYRAQLKAPRQGGDATVRVLVEGEPGSTTTVEFVQQGCTCAAGSMADGGALLFLCAVLLFFVARRARRAGS